MFAEQITSFSQNLNNLRDFVDTVSKFLEESTKNEMEKNASSFAPVILAIHEHNPKFFPIELDEEEIKKLREKNNSNITATVEELTEESGTISVTVPVSEQDGFQELINTAKSDERRKTALYQNSLISLVSSVEWFLAQLIHKHYKETPGMVGSKEKQFSLEDLAGFDSVEDARHYLVEKTVESVLRGSLNDWIDFLKQKLNLSMGYLNEHKDLLIEVTQRRNLLVHNGGVVNRIYLSNLPKSYQERPEIGKTIHISSEYLNNAISIFERCFLLIALELWKKVGANNEERGKLLVSLSYEHLISERYDVAGAISLFASQDKSLLESDRLYAKVNYWISKKFSGAFLEVKDEIVKEDFSAKSRLYILARNILLEDYYNALLDIEYLIEHEEGFELEVVKSWPLFKLFRSSEQYSELLSRHSETEN